MTSVHVTAHAAKRWIERVDPSSDSAKAVSAIRAFAPAIEVAARFGAKRVKLGSGVRLVLDGLNVVTVLPRGNFLMRPDHHGAVAEFQQ